MHSESILINALYYLLAAVVSVPLFKRLGLGSILGYLFAGVVLGPHALGLVHDPDEVLHFAEYGVILLLFIIGLELAPDKLWNMRGEVTLIGGSQLLISAVILGLFFLLIGSSLTQAIVLALTLGLSSTAFAIQLMSEEHILASPLGRKGFAILLLQDLAVIPILLLLGLLAQSGHQDEQLAWYWGLLTVLAMLAFSRFGLNQVLTIVANTRNREVMTAASLLIVIGVAVIMDAVGLSMGLGAFLAGIMLANSDFRHQLESDIEPFKGILLGLFFIAVGMTLNLALLFESPLPILLAAIGLMAIKTLVVVGILRWGQVSYKEGFQLGLILSQGGEFAFVILGQAAQLDFLSTQLGDQITLVVGVSMALTSPLVMMHHRLLRHRSDSQPNQDTHWDDNEPEVIIAGFGRFGQVVGRMLTSQHIHYTAMDKDPDHVEFVKRFGNKLFFGDLTRLDMLVSAGIQQARTLVVAVDDIEESLKIIDQAKELNPQINIVARAIDRFHAYELHARKVDSVIREIFPSSLEAATSTLLSLGYTEGQALEMSDRFRQYDEALLQKSVEHRDDMDELLNIAKEGRKELEHLFEEDKKDPVSA